MAAKNKKDDGIINTPEEMLEFEQEKLWENDPMGALQNANVEKRKKMNWMARFSLSLIIVLTFLFLVWLLFYAELPQASRDLVNIMVGAYVAVLAKATDYWFKDKDDPEHKESEANNDKEKDSF
tara:strand:+ start:175 stop:546 length:372 start_codon:yes stop_codon:yes gene_type:complete